MFERTSLKLLQKRVREPRNFIQVIMGPRQVGKTTLVRQLTGLLKIPYHLVSADETAASDTYWIGQQWEAARIKKTNSGSRELLIIIDEIQKINDWSAAVKKEWDKDTADNNTIKVLLLGSARLMLQQGLSESLAGRFEVIHVTHWTLQEMQTAFGFTEDQYVWFGGYPGGASLLKDERRWKEYILHSLVETTISKDILMMTRIDKPALLKKVFELGCLYSGQILSYSKMLGQLHDAGNTTTLSHYLELLGSAGLVSGLEKYSTEKIRTRGSSPKLQVRNTALLSALTETAFKETKKHPAIWGRHVESAVGAHLINACVSTNMNLYYWRHVHDEVDFILKKENRIIAIEVKSGAKHRLSGMNAFSKQFNPKKSLLVGTSGIPWQEFLKINPFELL